MKDIMKDINTAFTLISGILVSGDAVDAMAAARVKLRHAFEELKKLDEEGGEDE